jgi:hypothetical protein
VTGCAGVYRIYEIIFTGTKFRAPQGRERTASGASPGWGADKEEALKGRHISPYDKVMITRVGNITGVFPSMKDCHNARRGPYTPLYFHGQSDDL